MKCFKGFSFPVAYKRAYRKPFLLQKRSPPNPHWKSIDFHVIFPHSPYNSLELQKVCSYYNRLWKYLLQFSSVFIILFFLHLWASFISFLEWNWIKHRIAVFYELMINYWLAAYYVRKTCQICWRENFLKIDAIDRAKWLARSTKNNNGMLHVICSLSKWNFPVNNKIRKFIGKNWQIL